MKNYDALVEDLAPKKFGKYGKIWIGFLLAIIFGALGCYIVQLREGLIITDMRDYALWGIYISNFVFFVAISLVGSLITAILRLSGARWSTPLTRISRNYSGGSHYNGRTYYYYRYGETREAIQSFYSW